MNTFVLASFGPTDQADIDADLIINDEPMRFLELIAVSGRTRELEDAHTKLMSNPDAADVLILHLGSLQALNDAFVGGNDE